MLSLDVPVGQVADLRSVEQLTSLSDISRLLHETLARERGLEAELDHLLHRRGDLEQSLLALHASSREVQALLTVASSSLLDLQVARLQTLDVVKADAETLANSVQQTSNLSERVSQKVRELDTAQSRVNNTLQSIEHIVNRTNAEDGVQQALQNEDYEAAAEYVDTLLQSEEKYGSAHKDSYAKQSEQQSRVRLHLLQSMTLCVCPGMAQNSIYAMVLPAGTCRGPRNPQEGHSGSC